MNAPTPIAGYRPLAPEQVALMNRIKALGNEVGDLIADLRASYPPTPPAQVSGPAAQVFSIQHPVHGTLYSLDQRWVSLGATHLQEGFMALNRAVAQPSTFA